jgi:hypothetical protein
MHQKVQKLWQGPAAVCNKLIEFPSVYQTKAFLFFFSFLAQIELGYRFEENNSRDVVDLGRQ